LRIPAWQVWLSDFSQLGCASSRAALAIRIMSGYGVTAHGGFCCKSRKSSNPKNLAKVDLQTSLLLRRFSLRRFVIDFGSTDMVPHIAARKTHQRL
jgi:hypothetical protein